MFGYAVLTTASGYRYTSGSCEKHIYVIPVYQVEKRTPATRAVLRLQVTVAQIGHLRPTNLAKRGDDLGSGDGCQIN
jgi:hypothetical protein